MRFLISLFLLLSFALPHELAFAQQDEKTFADEGMDDLMVVAGIGAGGALLGLSTLSFVKEPKDHTDKIITGAAIGIIIGVIVVAVGQADKAQNRFEESRYIPTSDFTTHERIAQSVKNQQFEAIQISGDIFRFRF
jgi:hypothetical protein